MYMVLSCELEMGSHFRSWAAYVHALVVYTLKAGTIFRREAELCAGV